MIKNIVFDVGGVLLDYRWKDMLLDYGMKDADAEEFASLIFPNPLWEELDYDIVPQSDVIRRYQELYPKFSEVIGWFITHGEYMHVARPRVWELVQELKDKGYNLYILSNYSEELFTKHTENASFMDVMDGVLVSYMIHEIKPHPTIYQHLTQTYDLCPEECLFFDDREANVQAAKELGWEAVTVTSEEFLIQELEKILDNE